MINDNLAGALVNSFKQSSSLLQNSVDSILERRKDEIYSDIDVGMDFGDLMKDKTTWRKMIYSRMNIM